MLTAIEPLKMVMNMPMNMLTMRVYADGKNHPSKCQSSARRGKQLRYISGVSFVCSSWLFGSLCVAKFKGRRVRRNTSLYGRPWPQVDIDIDSSLEQLSPLKIAGPASAKYLRGLRKKNVLPRNQNFCAVLKTLGA